jgi:hypothetical protein
MRCLSAKEANQLREGTPRTIDRAHIFSAASYPKLIYNVNNIVSLHRYIHQRMDEYRNPLTGEQISDMNFHFYWWWRIKNAKVEDYTSDLDYEDLLRNEIK